MRSELRREAGVIHCIQAVAPEMIARRYGKIVNVTSIAGLGTTNGQHHGLGGHGLTALLRVA